MSAHITDSYAKPLPVITAENKPFWDACKAGELRMQQCAHCRHIRYPVNVVCPRCLSPAAEWVRLGGRGTVFSYIVFHQVYHQAYKDDVPYNVALIQLEEGPRMFSNVIGVPNASVKVGDAVEVVFDAVTPHVSLPRFRPVAAE